MTNAVTRRTFLQTTSALGAGIGLLGLPAGAPAAARAPRGAPQAEKLGWRLACNAYSFNKYTFYETIDKVSALGLKYLVGFNWQKLDPKRPAAIFNEQMPAADRLEVKKRLADAGLTLTCCYCRDFSKEDGCRRLFDFAREMGMETLDGEPPEDAFGMLDRLCGEFRLNVAVHNHAKPSHYWNPDTLMKIFHGRSPRIGACCDTGHWGRSGLSSVEMLRKLEGRILTFDLKDVTAEGVCVPFGKGRCDIRGILKELRRQRFRGVLGIEYAQRTSTHEAEIAECVVYFEKTAQELAAT